MHLSLHLCYWIEQLHHWCNLFLYFTQLDRSVLQQTNTRNGFADLITRILRINHIISGKRAGNLSRSSTHTKWTHQLILYSLGEMMRKYECESLVEDQVANMDETHIWYDIDSFIV